MKNKKPYKYNSKSRLTNSSSFPFKVNNIKNDPKKSLENTLTKFHIIEEIPSETESLDNSFLEGRNDKKDVKRKKNSLLKSKIGKFTDFVDKNVLVEEDKKEEPKIIKVEDFIEEKEDKKKDNSKKTISFSKISFFRKMFLRISAICAVLLILLVSSDYLRSALKTTTDRITNGSKNSSNVIDDNYLFVGGYHTNLFSFDEFDLDYHYVNVSGKNLTTSLLLENMKTMVYDYNPSIVFLEMGLSDLNNNISYDEFMNNYGRIIRNIKNNRPNAVICVESIYPVRNSRTDEVLSKEVTNNDISKLNSLLKDLAKENNILYLDVYSSLLKNGELNSKYTDDGLSLNKHGYEEVLKEVKKIIG